LQERLDLIVEQPRARGTSVAVAVSLIVHALFLVALALRKEPPVAKNQEQAVRFVQLLRQQQEQTHTEAPGEKVDSAPVKAPLSDANRRASMPRPTGDQPTLRPGDGSGLYQPGGAPRPQQRAQTSRESSSSQPSDQGERTNPQQQTPADTFTYQVPSAKANAAAPINWGSAIREVGKVASLGSGEGVAASGGEEGFAESGPISFETQWYDWGDYAQQMVAKIRHHWYANMPTLIRLGVRGSVTIQFTIQRNGQITDVRTIRTSEIPPYDFAARKAIELASPLQPLPADFPNSTERVTAQFFYNMNPPKR
jgi:TonB family protein